MSMHSPARSLPVNRTNLSSSFRSAILIAAAVAACSATSAMANPLTVINGSFEAGSVYNPDGVGIGHANLPAPWTSPTPGSGVVSGDTWSFAGGTRGLLPATNNVFSPSMTAYDGDRWAGGWNFEFISQPVSSVLIAGQSYSITAALHASNIGSGGSIEISFGNSVSDRSIIAGVLPGITTLADGWQVRTLTFVATSQMENATWFHYRAWSPTGAPVYMAVDAIPAPSAAALLGLGGLMVGRRRR